MKLSECCECCGQVLVDGPVDHPVWSALAALIAAMLIADVISRRP